MVRRGSRLRRRGSESRFGPWEGEVLRLRAPQVLPAEIAVQTAPRGHDEDLPRMDRCGARLDCRAAAARAAAPVPLAPSRPEGVELGTVPAADSPLAERDAGGNRFRRGQLIHSLLQHLPSVPAAARRPPPCVTSAGPATGCRPARLDVSRDEVLAVMAHPIWRRCSGRMAERRCR